MSQKRNKIILLIAIIIGLIILISFERYSNNFFHNSSKRDNIITQYKRCELHVDESQELGQHRFVTPPVIACVSNKHGVDLITDTNKVLIRDLFTHSVRNENLFLVVNESPIISRFLKDIQSHPDIITSQQHKDLSSVTKYQICAILMPKIDTTKIHIIQDNLYQGVIEGKYDNFICSNSLINPEEHNLLGLALDSSSLYQLPHLILQLYLIPTSTPIKTRSFTKSFNSYPHILQYTLNY